MQNWILGYADRVREAPGASIGESVAQVLEHSPRAALLKLRDAALDLQRLCELELQADRFASPEVGR